MKTGRKANSTSGIHEQTIFIVQSPCYLAIFQAKEKSASGQVVHTIRAW